MSLTKKSQKRCQKMKTLCTLDSGDIAINQDMYKSLVPKRKSKNKKKLSFLNNSPQKQFNSQFLNLNGSKTPNYKANRFKNSFQRSRTKTQYFDIPHERSQIKSKSCCKKIQFHCDQKYNFQAYSIIKKLAQTKDQKMYLVQYLHSLQKKGQYLMKKSKNHKKLKQFQRQLQIKKQLTDKMKASQKRYFSIIFKHYEQKKNLVLVYNLQGAQLDWHNETHKRFIKNLKKDNFHILKFLVKELSKSISILSFYGYAHSQIEANNILVQIQDNKEVLKVNKSFRLANLGLCIKVDQKKTFLQMKKSLITPPEIINYMIFQNENLHLRLQSFDRQLIEFIETKDQGWRIDVWSLGIFILELINEGPLVRQYLNLGEVLQYQKNIKLRSEFLIEKIQGEALKKLVIKMLETNPHKRPSPREIISALLTQ